MLRTRFGHSVLTNTCSFIYDLFNNVVSNAYCIRIIVRVLLNN